MSILNDLITILVLVLKKHALKYLGVEAHGIGKPLSNIKEKHMYRQIVKKVRQNGTNRQI